MKRKTVAVIGASADRSKYGSKAVRAYMQKGWEVYPVNLKGGEIEGLKVCTAVEQLPAGVDRVTLYLPPALGVKTLPAIAALGPAELFVNPGAESDELIAEATKLELDPILACSIVDIGLLPSDFPV